MKFHVTNAHNGKKYPAQGQFWPDYGWHIQVMDLSPGTWGRATSGVGDGPVIDQGWQKDLEQRGWTVPTLSRPQDVRGQEMDRLAKSLGGMAAPQEPPVKESRAAHIVARLLEDCGHCDTPTKVTLKPQDIDLGKISPAEKKMGTKVEKEHVVKAKDAIAVAAAHWKEDPNYYAKGKKKGVFPELGKPKSYLAGVDSLGL